MQSVFRLVECLEKQDQLSLKEESTLKALKFLMSTNNDLLSENLILKNLVDNYSTHKRAWDDCDGDRRSIAEYLYDAQEAMLKDIEIPTTESFSNSLRLEGVEMLLAWLPPYYTARSDIGKFANKLREGKL